MYGFVCVAQVTVSHHLLNLIPAQLVQRGRDVVVLPSSSDQPIREVYAILHSLHAARICPTPYGKAVKDMGEHMDWDEELQDFRGGVLPEFEEGHDDGGSLPDDAGYVLFPRQLLIEEYSEHFHCWGRVDGFFRDHVKT